MIYYYVPGTQYFTGSLINTRTGYWICLTKYSQSYVCENHLLCVLCSIFPSHVVVFEEV